MTPFSHARVAIALMAALAVACVAPGPAGAARVSASVDGIVFRAEAGEANTLTITGETGAIRFSDQVGLTAADGCLQVSAQEASCSLRQPRRGDPRVKEAIDGAEVHLGDGDDSVVYRSSRTGLFISVYGERGDDRLIGDGLQGLYLHGGPGADSLQGGDGDDSLDGYTGTDVISGGAGYDGVEYGGDIRTGLDRRQPVRVTLDGMPGDGVEGENDSIAGDVEAASAPPFQKDFVGGNEGRNILSGGGELRGYGGGDVLYGGRKGDRLFGGTGNDRIYDGLQGHDVLSGGPGNDRLRSVDHFYDPDSGSETGPVRPARDVVRCGPGVDFVVADSADRVARDCEHVKRVRAKR